MKSETGRVALVVGAGEGVLRAIALALAARGLRIVVTGGPEKALAETVGEIAFGGGKARHVTGGVAAAVDRAVEVFGAVDLAITADAADLELVAARTDGRARLVLVRAGEAPSDARWTSIALPAAADEDEAAQHVVRALALA